VLGALAEPPDPALDAALGARRADALRAAVRARVAAVAEAVADRVLVAETLPDLDGHDGPLLLLAPDVPRIDVALVAAALRDLDEGCAIALSSGFEARACLVALPRPDARLLELVCGGGERAAIVGLVESAGDAGEVGFLRHERRLVTPGDAAALAADPLTDTELKKLAAAPAPR
jgi:hypothetical protein